MLRVRLLGPVDVTVDGTPRPVPGLRRRAVLAALAVQPREIVSADRIIDIVWGDTVPVTATNTLQSQISRLRSILGDRAAILGRPPGYVLDIGDEATDVETAERLIRQGIQATDPVHSASQLQAAVALWRGQPLADVAGLAWFADHAQRLDHLLLQARHALIDVRLALGQHTQLLPELESLSRQYPLNEQIHRQLMLALYRTGRQADALAAYQRIRHTLDEDLGIDPGQGLRDLETAILRQDPTLDASPPASPGPVVVHGKVRVLGPVEIIGPNGPARLAGARQRAVVGLLALKVGTVVPGWRLVHALWGDDPPRTALRSLHSHIARVRQALETCGLPDILVTRDSGYALLMKPDSVDAWCFEEHVRRGRAEFTDTAHDAVQRGVTILRDGLSLWRHEVALADAEPTGWGAAEVDRLSEVRLTATEDRWDAELRLGQHAEAIGELERLLVVHPLRERLVGILMLALYRAGRHANALEAYQRLRTRLADELGADPGPELLRLHTQILRRDPGLGLDAIRSGGVDAGPPMPGPAQLPARVGHFTGRVRELAALDQLVDDHNQETHIAVISGAAGMGKTALAVQWAYRVADRFPDGQLFIDVRGHDSQTALPASVALSHLLFSLGVPADRIPTELAEQAGLYRSLLNGKRILVVLDNGGATDDILPLVPPGAGNLLVVTSRNTMTALATHHAVCPVGVDVLSEDEALALLAKVLGIPLVDGDRDGAVELARLCGRMPLALRIAAAKLASQPQRTIRELTNDLASANRLDVLTLDGDSRSVRAVFVSAYHALSTPAARVFRLLGLHPGQTFTPHVAAALADLPLRAARQAVEELVTAHLAIRTRTDRYRFHDLIQLFTLQCAGVDEPPQQRVDAVARLIDWYLTVVDAANRAVHPGRDRVTPAPRYRPAELPFPLDHEAALAFLDDERGNLPPIVRYAAEGAHPEAAWQLTYLLSGFYDSRSHREERVEMCRWGVIAAQRAGGLDAEGLMRSGLGVAYIAARRFDEALESLHKALPLMRAAGDQRGEGHVYNNIAVACSSLRRFDEAADALQHALAIHTANGYRLGIALALNNKGHTYVRMGRPELSFADLSQALDIFRDIDNPRLEAATLHSLGDADLGHGDPEGALDHLRQALMIYRRLGARRDEAATLNGIGMVHLRRGDQQAALSHLHQARALARKVDDEHLEAIALNNIGQTHLSTGDLAATRHHLGLAFALRARVPDPYEEAHLHGNLGDLEQRSGDPDRAEYHRDLAIRLYRKVNAMADADRLAAPRRGGRPAATPAAWSTGPGWSPVHDGNHSKTILDRPH